jgi:hypothetical protein
MLPSVGEGRRMDAHTQTRFVTSRGRWCAVMRLMKFAHSSGFRGQLRGSQDSSARTHLVEVFGVALERFGLV